MAESEGQEKTEQASGKKLNESRQKGQVAKSTEIVSFAIFGTGLLLIYMSRQYMSDQISFFTKYIFNSLDVLTINKTVIQLYAIKFTLLFFLTLAPVFIGLVVMAFVVNVAQVGMKFSMKALKPQPGRFNVLQGIKKVFFSSKSIIEVAKGLLKLFVIGFFTYLVVKDFVVASISLPSYSIESIVAFMIDSSVNLLWKISLIFAVIAASDFVYQKIKFKKDMMMTKHEVKEEHRQDEGDPMIKSKIKNLQIAASRRRMMREIPTADVVITNPTHYAIALKYDPSKSTSPKVIAKGVDELAQRIKKIAVENNVPLHEDRELARSLYKFCEIGEEIPEVLYHAVAKVLAYIFGLKNKKKRKSIV